MEVLLGAEGTCGFQLFIVADFGIFEEVDGPHSAEVLSPCAWTATDQRDRDEGRAPDASLFP